MGVPHPVLMGLSAAIFGSLAPLWENSLSHVASCVNWRISGSGRTRPLLRPFFGSLAPPGKFASLCGLFCKLAYFRVWRPLSQFGTRPLAFNGAFFGPGKQSPTTDQTATKPPRRTRHKVEQKRLNLAHDGRQQPISTETSHFGHTNTDFGTQNNFGTNKTQFGTTNTELGHTETKFGTTTAQFGTRAKFGTTKPIPAQTQPMRHNKNRARFLSTRVARPPQQSAAP